MPKHSEQSHGSFWSALEGSEEVHEWRQATSAYLSGLFIAENIVHSIHDKRCELVKALRGIGHGVQRDTLAH